MGCEHVTAPVTQADWPMLMIQAEIASGKATVRSLGVLYMVAMASRASRQGEPFASFADINGAIMDCRCPGGDAAARAMSLEPIKKIAWAQYEAICRFARPALNPGAHP